MGWLGEGLRRLVLLSKRASLQQRQTCKERFLVSCPLHFGQVNAILVHFPQWGKLT